MPDYMIRQVGDGQFLMHRPSLFERVKMAKANASNGWRMYRTIRHMVAHQKVAIPVGTEEGTATLYGISEAPKGEEHVLRAPVVFLEESDAQNAVDQLNHFQGDDADYAVCTYQIAIRG